jgi:ankyrin repeat protein
MINKRVNGFALGLIMVFISSPNAYGMQVFDNDASADLFNAAQSGVLKKAELAIKNHANPNVCDKNSWSAAHEACTQNNTNILMFLADNGASLDVTTNKGLTLFDVACDSPRTCMVTARKHKELVLYLLSKKLGTLPLLTNARSILHWACEKGFIEVVKVLIEEKKIDLEIKDANGHTPLQVACNFPRISEAVKKWGRWPGKKKIELERINKEIGELVFYLLLRGANYSLPLENGHTLVHWACKTGHLEILKFLFDKGMSITEKTDNNWRLSPLHIASGKGRLNILKFLFEQKDQQCNDINGQDQTGKTPLHYAAIEGRADVVALLLSNKADPRLKDSDGQTPYDRAVFRGNLEAFKNFLTVMSAQRKKGTEFVLSECKTPVDLETFAPGYARIKKLLLSANTTM